MKYMTFCGGINGDGERKSKNNEIYLLSKYIKNVLWGVVVCLSYI